MILTSFWLPLWDCKPHDGLYATPNIPGDGFLLWRRGTCRAFNLLVNSKANNHLWNIITLLERNVVSWFCPPYLVVSIPALQIDVLGRFWLLSGTLSLCHHYLRLQKMTETRGTRGQSKWNLHRPHQIRSLWRFLKLVTFLNSWCGLSLGHGVEDVFPWCCPSAGQAAAAPP